jgi:hypothetical protein
MAHRTVTIEKDGVKAEVIPSAVKVYTRKGWSVVEPDEKEKARLSEADLAQIDKAKEQAKKAEKAEEQKPQEQTPLPEAGKKPEDVVEVVDPGSAGQGSDNGSDVKKRR